MATGGCLATNKPEVEFWEYARDMRESGKTVMRISWSAGTPPVEYQVIYLVLNSTLCIEWGSESRIVRA